MNLKKLAPAFSILLAFAAALALLPASAQAPVRKPRVAVLDFDYATVQSTTSAMFGTRYSVASNGMDRSAAG